MAHWQWFAYRTCKLTRCASSGFRWHRIQFGECCGWTHEAPTHFKDWCYYCHYQGSAPLFEYLIIFYFNTFFNCHYGFIAKKILLIVVLVIGRDLQPGSSPWVHLPEAIYSESRWHSGSATSTLQPCCWRSLKWGWGGRGGPPHIQPAAGGTREQQTVSATWTVWRWVHNTIE